MIKVKTHEWWNEPQRFARAIHHYEDLKKKTFCHFVDMADIKTMYKTNRFHLAVHVYSDNVQRRQNVVRTSSTLLLCSYHVLTSCVRYQSTHARPNGIYLLNIPLIEVHKIFIFKATPGGHALLISSLGYGRRTLTRVTAHAARCKVCILFHVNGIKVTVFWF